MLWLIRKGSDEIMNFDAALINGDEKVLGAVDSFFIEFIYMLVKQETMKLSHPIGHVNTFTTMQFFTGISRNTLSKSYMLLSVSGISKFMHILINMPYHFALELSQ